MLLFRRIRGISSRNIVSTVLDSCPINVQNRLISTSGCLTAKLFRDSENSHAHSILENLGTYQVIKYPDYNLPSIKESQFTSYCEKNWDNLETKEILDALESLAEISKKLDLAISDERFDGLVKVIVKKCSTYTDEEIMRTLRILTIFPPTEEVGSRNFLQLWKTLDEVCVNRLETWDIGKQLLVCDHWYKLNMAKISNFPFQSTKKNGRKLRRLSPNQLVQTMFYVNMQRKPVIEMYDFELALTNVIDKLNIDEVAIMAMGFFKTQTKLKDPDLVDKILKMVTKETQTISDISLVAILKIVRYSARRRHAELINQLSEKLRPEIQRLNLLGCLHLALIGTSFQCYDKETIEEVINRFVKDYKTARLKDFERIGFVMGLYDIEMENGNKDKLCDLILQELPERKEEIVRHVRCLPSLLHYMTICGKYNEELMNTVLDPQYYKHAYGSNLLLGRDLFCLDSYTRINLKDTYKGIQLNEKIRKNFAKMLSCYVPEKGQTYKLSAADRSLLEVHDIIGDIVGHDCTIIEHLLPHYERPDILTVFQKSTKKPVKMSSLNLHGHYSGVIMSKEELLAKVENADDFEVVTFVFGGSNSYVKETNKKTGLLRMKIDQLKLVGHIPIEVPFFEWQTRTTETRTEYLRNLMAENLSKTFPP